MPESRLSIPAPRVWTLICGGLVILGIGLRFYHLDYKVYWIDEVNTTLRSLGYTQAEVTATLLTGEPFTVAELQAFQQLSPEHGWDDTWMALRGSAEHTPLYFLLSRLWVEWFGSTVAVWRSVAAILSLLTFPALFWLCWELFQTTLPGWVAMGWVAVSPLHVLYAQEARPYSLLAALTLVSSASLLWAMRTRRWYPWGVYGLTVVLGLYSQLLFGLVAIAHALYIVIIEKGRFTPTVGRYTLVAAAALVAFAPWLGILLTNLATVQRKTASLGDDRYSVADLLDRWFRVLNQMLIDWELAGWNFLLGLLAIAALIVLIHQAPRRAWLLLLLLGGVPFLALALPDLLLGGERSLRVRYLFPTALCLHITLAYGFAGAISRPRRSHPPGPEKPADGVNRKPHGFPFNSWQQNLLVGLLLVQIISCAVTSQKTLWWNKSRPRSTYYQPVAEILNSVPQPWVLTESRVSDLLALSYFLHPGITLQAVPDPALPWKRPDTPNLYLLNGSPATVARLQQQNYLLRPLYPAQGSEMVRLWYLENH